MSNLRALERRVQRGAQQRIAGNIRQTERAASAAVQQANASGRPVCACGFDVRIVGPNETEAAHSAPAVLCDVCGLERVRTVYTVR